jgi:hypothetical protein
MLSSKFIKGTATNKHVSSLLQVPPKIAMLGLAALLLSLGVITLPRAADATPAFAAKTGFACGKCHVSAAGGGKLTGYGQSYKAKGK